MSNEEENIFLQDEYKEMTDAPRGALCVDFKGGIFIKTHFDLWIRLIDILDHSLRVEPGKYTATYLYREMGARLLKAR